MLHYRWWSLHHSKKDTFLNFKIHEFFCNTEEVILNSVNSDKGLLLNNKSSVLPLQWSPKENKSVTTCLCLDGKLFNHCCTDIWGNTSLLVGMEGVIMFPWTCLTATVNMGSGQYESDINIWTPLGMATCD